MSSAASSAPQDTLSAESTSELIETALGTTTATPLNTKWYVSGLGAGTVGSVLFSDVEHLVGGDDNEDEFEFGATGGLTGTVEGGARGYDTVVLGGGTFDSVVFTAANANDGTIARDGDVITYKGFEPITDNTDTANRVIEASIIADEIKISRTGGGKIKVESVNDLSTFESIEFNDPTSSLTIKSSGYIAGPVGADTVTIETLGTFAADLIIETGSLNRMEDGEDSITFVGDIDLQGKKLQATAETITVNNGVTLKTSNTAGAAGDITLDSWHTTITTNAKLLAEGADAAGSQHGDITITAIDDNGIFTPVVAIELKDVGVDIQGGTQIKGDDVTIIAKVDASSIFGNTNELKESDPSTWAKIGDAALAKLEGLSQVVAAVAVTTSEATVDIAAGSTIVAKGDFEVRATAVASPEASPKFTSKVGEKIGVPLPALAVAVAVTDAHITIGGNVEVGGNATIAAKGDHTLQATSDASEVKRVAAAGALTVLDSDISAHVTDDATLTVGGDLIVEAFTIDRNRTAAQSNAGKEGDIAISVAVSIENGQTSAFLDGTATVGGDVTVNATQQKEQIDAKALLIIPTLDSGTFAGAGVGSDDGDDLLDDAQSALMNDAKSGLAKFGTWVKEKWTGKASEEQQKDKTVTKDNAFKFDAAAAIAVAVDANVTTARIGDGNADADGKSGVVTATGNVSVLSSVSSRPDITAASATLSDTKASGGDTTKFGGSLAVAVGVYTNDAYAHVSEQAQVTSAKDISVDAKTLNEIDPLGLWGVNLISPFLKSADFDTTQGTKSVENGKIVEVKSDHTAGGDSGTWYKYIGTASAKNIDLGNEDFSNELQWKSLGNPIKHIIVDTWVPNVASYLNSNLGLDDNLADTWSQATAKGDAKTAIAGAVTVIDLDQTAEAVIKSGAKINDGVVSNGNRTVSVTASSVSHLVNLAGNVQLPGLTTSGEDIKSFKVDFQKPGLGSDAGKDGNAAGATVMVFDLDNTVTARVEDAAKITGDSLQVTADTFVLNASLGASGGASDNFGLNGVFIASMVDNATLAQIENGATIAIGAKAVSDTDGKDASVFLGAQDKTYIVDLAGGVATSQHIGVGLSVGVNLVNRDTEAVIGNRHDKSLADTRGVFTALGDVRLDARNEGFVGSVVVAGSKASQKSEDPTATSGDTGMKTSDGSSTDDPGKWPNNQKSYDSVIAQLKQQQMGGSAPAGDESTGKQQGKAGIAVSGAAAVTVIDDNARAYIHETGVMTATGKAVSLTAANNSHVGSLAGGIAFAGDPASTKSDVAIAGAFGGNFVSGTTQSFLDDATSVSSKTLSIEADRGGWVVSLTAGVSGASGRKGIAVGGSVGVTMTDYTTEASLSSTTGTIAGALTVNASDDTNIILVAGSAGFGGKAGIGAAVAFAEIGNTTRATISSVTDLKHTGALTVSATAEGMIIAVTGSAGVGSGENSKAGLAGTVTVNRISNVVEAKILNSTFHKDSTGDIRIDATDNSFIFSFAGAFGASKSVGLGVAAAVNLLENTVRAEVSNSTLRSTGKLDVDADATGTLVSVALGVGAGKQFAGAGSIAVNIIDNTIESQIINGSDVQVGGAIDVSADDRSVGVAIGGGAAFGKTAAVGAAFAGNFETNILKAKIDDSLVESTNSTAALGAEARATLVSIAIGGAGGDTFALGGSISVNQVENGIEALVTDANGAGTGKATLLKAKNDISIAAADDTTMVIVAGGLAFAKTAAIGVSASTAQIQNKVHAYVDASKVESTSGKISVSAGFRPPDTDADMTAIALGTNGIEMPEAAGSQIVNIAVGVAGSGTFAGGGAFSLNWVRNDVKAYVANSATLTAAGDVTLAAFDDPEIDSFAVGGGIGTGTAGAALGLSYNYIGGDPGNPSRDIPADPGSANVGKALASVNASTITSTGGSVSILAGTTPKIINATIAGAGGGTAGVGGSISINFIRSIVDASVTGGSSIAANNDIKVGASAVPVMITIAGNVSIGGTAGIGAAVATNDMQSKITARIDGSKAKATTGDIIVDASIGKAAVLPSLKTDVPVDAQIWSFSVSGAGAGTAAIAGSASLNWMRNVVEASISNIGNIDVSADEISAGGKVSVTASDASTLNSLAGGFAVQIGSPGVAAGASVAYNYLGGDPNSPGSTDNNRVKASIENVTGQLKAGSIEVKSSYTGSINNLTIGGAGGTGFALGGAVSINKIRNTADAHISGSTGISTTSGNVTIQATDTSTIRALAGGVGVAIAPGGGAAAAVGVSVAVNTINNTTKAYIDKSSVTSAAGLMLTADSKQKIQTLTVGGSVAGAAGDGVAIAAAGSGSGNTVTNQVLAYITNSGGANEIKASNGSIVLTAKDESTIEAASGAVAVSVAAGSTIGGAGSIGISAADNDITNTIKAFIDASKVTATKGDVELKATESATIKALAMGGSVAVGAGGIGAGAIAGAGAGTGNTIRNTVQAYVSGTSTVSTVTSGSVKLTASDTSQITADSGGVAVAIAVGGAGSAGASFGASIAVNDITNTVQSYIDSSTVTSAGAVELTATSAPTIDAFSLAGAVSGAVSGGGAGALAGAGSGASNTIGNTVQAYINGATSKVTSLGGAVKLTSSDTSKIHVDGGGVAVSVAVGAAGGVGGAVGASVAVNEITNTVQAYVQSSEVTSAGAVELSATSTPTIEAVSIAAAVAVSGGAGGGLSGSGAGASTDNTIANTVEAYAKSATITSQNAGTISLKASETGQITAHTFGGSVAVAAGAVGGAVAISVSLAENDVNSAIRAYSDQTKITSAGALELIASSSETTESTSVAVSVAVAGAPIGGAFSGGGANSFSRVHNTVEAYAKGLDATSKSTIQAAGLVTISASETSQMKADVGAAAVSGGLAGGSIGVSIASNKADSTINAYVDNATVTSTSNGVSISATANDTISKTLGVATALAVGVGGSAAGAEATATVTPTINAYIGSGATVNAAELVGVTATSTASVNAETVGASGGLVSVGASVAKSTVGGTIQAYVDGTIASSRNVAVSADAKQTAKAKATAVSGGIFSGAGADADAIVDPTVKVYGAGRITASESISFAATATPEAIASALGVSVGVGSAGVSDASAFASPNIEASPGGASTLYTAKNVSVSTAINVPTGSYTAKANSTGATGGLISVNATSVSAITSGKSYSTINDGSTLLVSDAVSITAKGDSKQRADADSFNVGLVAVGGNVSVAKATVDTRAFLGKEVTISNGTDVGGLSDGGRYYVVLDDRRAFTAGGVDTSNSGGTSNSIDLGADHGLRTGDRVVYKAGASTITGLVGFETYSVELVGGTNRVRLRSINDAGVVGGIVDLQSAQAGTFQLADARRVRLATSSDNALKATPVVINIDAGIATGSKHQLTPVTGFAAGALEFNPSTQASSSKDTLELPSGHGLLTGAAVTYGRSGGAVLTISATGTDYVHAISESGSGGLVAGAAATANTIVDSKTKAFVSDDTDGDAAKTLLRVSKLNINATHTSQYDSELSSVQASLLGYSGGWANNDIKATVEATIGAGADVVTQDVMMTAVNKTRKDIVSGPNVKSGSGGVFQGNNAESVSNLENRTSAAIGNNASVKVTGSVLAPGNFLLSAYNEHLGDDEVLLDTGGAIVGSGVKSHIKVNVNDATASIGNFATIETVGALDMQTRARGELSTHPQAHTYGLAGGAGVDSLVHINNDNLVSIGTDTTVQALGDINMLAGKDRDGARNFFKIRSHGDDLNATAVPIGTLKSHVQLEQDNDVVIGERAVVRTARDANLIGETLSTADIVSFGTGKNWLTAIAGGIDSLLGGGGASEEEKGGTTEHPQSQTVTVNGIVEVGILKDQTLIIDKGAGTSESELTKIRTNVGNIKVTTTIESLSTNLVSERQRLLQLISEYQGDLESIAAYTAALQQVEQQMEDLGLVVETTDGLGNKVKSVQEGFSVPYITVDPIWAQSGTIRISGGSVLGTGQLKAPGNVNVTIINNSPAYMRLKGITIPDNEGGRVRLNGVDVTAIDSFDGTIISSKDGASPTVVVASTFDEADPANFNHATWKLFRTPDLEIAGEISALQADVTLSSAGSVLARSNILAGKLTINAGKDFVLTSTESLFNAGGSPASALGPWAAVQAAAEAAGTAGGVNQSGSVKVGGAGSGIAGTLASAVNTALGKGPESNIVAANNIVIVAQTINVNGVLQAGIADHKAVIDSSFSSKISAAETARTQFLNGQVGAAYFTASLAGIAPDEGFTYFKLTGPTLAVDPSGLEYSKSTSTTNNLPVYYNAQSDRLEVSPVRVQGGFMSLTGRILNTNQNAEIRVMDGYGRITIQNDLNIPLQINRLDTGAPGKTNEGIEGKLIITDSGDKNGAGAPLVTEYTRLGSDIQKKQYYFVTPGTTPTVLDTDTFSNTRQASYTPESVGYRFYWTTGQDSTKKTYTSYGTSAWLNIEAFAPDPSDITDGPHVEYATPRALAKGDYLAVGPTVNAPDYTYEFERIMQGTPQTKVDRRWETSTWYGETTYYTKTLTWQGQKDVHTHSIRADRPVTINFIGYNAGSSSVTVTTKGSLSINGEIQNSQGTTSLTATLGSITHDNDSVAVGGRSISLTAGGSIGGDAPIRTNLTNGGGGSLSAVAADVVRIEEITGDLTVNQVKVNTSGDRVELKAATGSILGVSGNLVQGGLVTLDAAGSIGSLGSGGSARTPGAGAQAIIIDTGNTSRDTFTAKALGDVFVREKAGDLRLVTVDTRDPSSGIAAGDVRLEVATGRMVDANTFEVKDLRTETALMGIWDAMHATESTAYVSIEQTVRAFEQGRTREYQAYWNYRHSQDDGGTKYDDKFSVTLSAAEVDAFSAYYVSQGFTQAEIDDAIQTLENGRTKEYHDLHKTYGRFGETFEGDYRYGTAVTQAFGGAAVDVGTESITIKGNVFDTGDAVVYHSGGGSIAGLVDGTTYYVVADAVAAGKFRLASTREDALDGKSTVLLSGAVAGTSHLFSAADNTFTAAKVDDGSNTIELARHTFTTGTAVVFQSSGAGTIAGLTDGQTYYVVADAATGKIQLAGSHADATKGTPAVIDLGAASGSGFLFSEADTLANKAAWSESQLKNSFSSKVLGPKGSSGTTATKEDPNIIGIDIVLDVGTHVGSFEKTVDIQLPLTAAGLSDTQKLALAAAERADVTFYADDAGLVEVDDPRVTSETVRLIRIVPKADVDVTVKGALTIVSGATVNVGSEETLSIDQVMAAQSTRITGQKALTDAKISAVNVISGDLILEAEEQGIGVDSELVLNLHDGAALIARAHDDINLHETAGDMRLIEITSTDGKVNLVADGSILDHDVDDAGSQDWNIMAESLTLEAGWNTGTGSIGTGTDYLEIELAAGGQLHAVGDAGVHLHEVSGNMLVDLVQSTGGDVRLRADNSILDFKADFVTDVFGRSITLTADFDSIGGPAADLEIDSAFGGAGSVTTKSAKNVHLVENAGDLRLGTVSVDAGTAFIKAINGSIFDADNDEATANVLSGNVWLFASQNIGTSANRLTTVSGKLEAQSTKGSTYILNTGALEVGGVTGGESGISSGGEVSLTSKSPITVAKHITAVDDVKIVATDDGSDGDFVVVEKGYTVTSTAGSITLLAGDEVTFEQGVQITAHKNVTVTGADDGGEADDVLVGTDVTITAATGAIAIQAGDGFTIEKGAELSAFGNVMVTTTDDAVGGANGDFLLVKNGATITSATGLIELRAGDDLTIEQGAFVDADTSIILRADYKSADANGGAITIEGALQAPNMQLHGDEQADTIVLRPESLVGDTQVFGHGGDDTITLDRLPSVTTTQVIADKVVRDTIDLDGGEGKDAYVINITGGQTDYLVNINDTGASTNDEVTVNATADNDLLLLREKFLAYLVPEAPLTAGAQPGKAHLEVERINYNSSIDHLKINTLGGDDQIYVDDNSAKTTLDGGEGKDFFQFGQLFGTKREAPAVAVGDEISALRTTLGWLSRGVSQQTIAMGGDGEDTFQVYSNQAELQLEGNDGDDTFIVRSFALADEQGNALIDQSMSKLASAMGGTGNDVVQYNVNANLAIDGGTGDDRFILLGSELSDDFVITESNVFGGGQSVTYQNVEKVTVDGLQGNDNFFILGTKAGVLTTVAGGHGWDTFHVGGDITRPIVSKAFADLNLAGDHFAAGTINGPLVIEGGFGPDDFSLRQAVILPTETDEVLNQLVNPADDDESIDTLNIFNDGSSANQVATLTDVNFRIEGMSQGLTLGSGVEIAGGITYQHVETLEIMLGTGDDTLTIAATMDAAVDGDRGPLTIVHGGGGSDHITVNGGGGADSPLVIFGDSEDDGARYAGEASKISGLAWRFTNAGNDVIDASAADGAVAIYGGRGADTITGSAFGDQLAGGTGDDTIDGLAGDDLVYGDSGFTVGEAAVTIPEPNNAGGTAARTIYTRSVIVADTPDGGADLWADTLAGSNDVINGGDGNDIVIGDLGLITQDLSELLDGNLNNHENLYNTANVVLVETKSVESGGDDVISATSGDDIVLGGSGADTIDAGDGDNIVIGDNGIVELPGGERYRIASSDFAFGGNDTITTFGGNDVVVGGNADDTIDAGDGDNLVFGDDGEIVYAIDGRLDHVASTSTAANGGVDHITAGADEDIVLGGRFGDTINAGAGDNVVFGDSGQLVANPLSTTERLAGHPLPTGTFQTIEHGDGGDDTITTAGGEDIVVGGHADDTIDGGDGDNLVFGDDGAILYATDGRLSSITSTSTTAHGGVDAITTGAGQDIVLGGRFGDTIHAGAGNNMVFGDSGQLVAETSSIVYPWASHPLSIGMLETIEPGDGGNDTITTLGGSDLLIGGDGADAIDAGAGDDFVIADHATVEYADGVAVTITTTDTAIGGDDTIHAGADDDVVIGGTGADSIDGGSGRDLLLGDSATLDRTSTLGDFRNPRFRALTGTQIYSVAPATAGQLLIDTGAYYADPRGPAEWADFQITLQHHDATTAAMLYGNDYLAGGADDDTIFGQLGDDVIQGDGSIDFLSGGGRVGAVRDAAGDLQLRASFEAAGDGHDYIEGGGGADVLFGNNGQDDIIGGSSSLFSASTPARRPDAADLIFGGAGTDAGRNDAGDITAQGHAIDADTIVGDNGNIYRLVGVNGAPNGGGGVATANGFLAFNYDNYTNALPAAQQVQIVPRGVTLLDYTAGGPDLAVQVGPMVVGDIGAADEIHGEAGDDVAYGGAGSDVLFGDAQDDDLIGGYGNDWISGGTGEDGILGDDGRIFTSRNGMAEPLNGVSTARAQALLEGNGNGSINATVHVTGTLQKDADLTPFELDPNRDMLFDPQFADDIIFGGLGRDFIHAGAGDDAVSGAEALNTAYMVRGLVRSDFNRPNNPGDALDYNETSTLFAQYDANNPMRRILLNADGTLSTNNTGAEFFLNFDPTEGPLTAGSTAAHTDGDDIIFGDMGNDWLVGGTGRDHVFAGWGDDLVNLDDDHRTSGGLNNTPDAQASYADLAYGGAGRDVLIANTAGDNMVDTNGEFNSFLVPFAKYGPPTVNRMLNPQMEQFLYSLGKADGSDQTLSAPGNPFGGTAARLGEPFGELGLITPQDEAAGAQHGGPRDPQAGNEGGTSVDSTTTTSSTSSGKKSASSGSTTTANSTDTTGTASSLTTSTVPTAPTTLTTTTSTTSTPSIDWSGKTADVTVLPWAQGTQTKPVGLSVPTFDVDDDDDDLIDWNVAPTAAPVSVSPSTTPLSAAPKSNGNGNGNASGHTKK